MAEAKPRATRSNRTAQQLLSTRVPTTTPETTIGDVERLLVEKTAAFDSIDYVYVLDADGKLVGVISIKDVFRKPKDAPVGSADVNPMITARPNASQERVAHLALKHNIKAVPVVDLNEKFLGVVLNDTILRVLYQETSEDLFRLAGIKRTATAYDNVATIPLGASLVHRLPWLLIGIVGGVLIAGIIGQFERTLEQNLILAAFIPLLVYIADAVGTQMEAFIIRDLAVDPSFKFPRYFARQLLVIGAIALITGAALSAFTAAWYRDFRLSLVLGISLIITILSSVVTGLLIPFAFNKLKQDPAVASGPIATIIQDALSVLIYFSIAAWLL